ncbi:MAG: hypothetical protein ABIA77_04195 [Candidatus Omnitrophota bacterium]
MESINAYFEIKKDKTYNGAIRVYGFKILFELEPIFDNESGSVRLIANFSQNRLFDKLDKKFQKELKLSLTAGICQCYKKYTQEKTNKESLEKAIDEELKMESLKNEEDWDCVTSDMILQVPKRVKEAIEKIASEDK